MLNTAERIKLIRERLTTTFSPTHLEIIDESHLHQGHAGAKTGRGHFAINIAAKDLNNQSLMAAHRLIYQALGELMTDEIHALRIKIIK